MKTYILYIKNMACPRCLWAVESLLDNLGIEYKEVRIGEVITNQPIREIQKIEELKAALLQLGFELLEEKKTRMVERIKIFIAQWIQHENAELEKSRFSDYLVQKIGRDYGSLSTIFSELEHITIEKYMINQKIKRAKELVIFDELNFAQISYELGYSSPAHFSSQFKAITGYSPFQYKKMHKNAEA